jgi:hypothetical protein
MEDPTPINRNLIITMTGIWGCSNSIWTGALLSNWVFALTGSNEKVGMVTAANGLAELASALPVGMRNETTIELIQIN